MQVFDESFYSKLEFKVDNINYRISNKVLIDNFSVKYKVVIK